MTEEGDRGNLTKFWRNTHLELSAPVEKGHLKKGNIVRKKILPFVIQYHPALSKLKNILMGNGTLLKIKSEKIILVKTNLRRLKFTIAFGWQECHAGSSILQVLTDHLPLVICETRDEQNVSTIVLISDRSVF